MDAALAPADPSASAVGTALPLLVFLTTSGGKARRKPRHVLLGPTHSIAAFPTTFGRSLLAYSEPRRGDLMFTTAASELIPWAHPHWRP